MPISLYFFFSVRAYFSVWLARNSPYFQGKSKLISLSLPHLFAISRGRGDNFEGHQVPKTEIVPLRAIEEKQNFFSRVIIVKGVFRKFSLIHYLF